MSLADQTPVSTYTGNGVTTSFLYDFKIFLASDLVVEVNDVVVPTGYSVTGVGNSSGDVVFTVAPVSGARITLYRAVSFSRSVDYQYQGDLPSDVVNKDVDRVWMAAQELAAQVDRSLRLPISVSSVDVTLPTPVAGRSIKWSPDGLSLVNTTYDPDVLADAAADSAAAAAASESAVNAAAAEVEIDRVSAEAAAVAAAASAASIDPANLVHRTGAESIAGVKTFTNSPVVQSDFCWMTKAIGEPFALRDDLAGVEIPPTDNAAYRYIRLTASDAYNSGVLTSQSVSGSAPDVIATAVISLAGSPINGLTINLLNTERRFIRAGSSGTVEADSLRSHLHGIPGYIPGGNGSLYESLPTGGGLQVSSSSNTSATGATETKPKNQGATFYMRVK